MNLATDSKQGCLEQPEFVHSGLSVIPIRNKSRFQCQWTERQTSCGKTPIA